MLESLGHSELSVTGLQTVRGKILQGQGKVRELYFESGKIDVLKKSPRKLIRDNLTKLI